MCESSSAWSDANLHIPRIQAKECELLSRRLNYMRLRKKYQFSLEELAKWLAVSDECFER